MKINFIMTSCGSGKDPHQPSTWKVSEILRRVLMSGGGGGGGQIKRLSTWDRVQISSRTTR